MLLWVYSETMMIERHTPGNASPTSQGDNNSGEEMNMETIMMHNGASKVEIEGETVRTYTRPDIDGGFGEWRLNKTMTMTTELRARFDALRAEQAARTTVHMGRLA